MPRITLSVPDDVDALGERWRALEAEADGSFFQSWTWVGCLARERFPAPVLLAAEAEDGTPLALALFNRRASLLGETLWLNESGEAGWDSLYVEHNGPLLRRDAAHLLAPCLAAARSMPLPGRRRAGRFLALGRSVVLSGVGEQVAAAAMMPGTLRRKPARMAPCVDLAALRAAGADAFAPLSANTRHQLRRSLRRYAEAGELSLTRARDTAEAHGFLDALAALHQARWQARGQPGAFADPRFLRFHRALLARALPRGEAELVRVAAGPQMIGYLYNFLWRGEVLAYQSGFAYPPDGQRKPGLTCHHLAIAAHLAAGAQVYDFLAGEDRYKTSLANAARRLHWLELGPRWRPRAIRARLKGAPLTGD